MIGDLLVRVGLISSFDLTESIQVSKRLHMPIGRVLIMNGTITQENLQSALQAQSMIRDGVITLDVAVEALQMTNAENIPLEESLKKLDKSPQFSSTTNRLGELLLEANLVSNYQLEDALKMSFETQMPLGATLVSQGYLAPSLLPTVLRAQEQIREGLVTREAAIRELRSALVIWEKAEESLKQMTYAHESRKSTLPEVKSAPAQVTSMGHAGQSSQSAQTNNPAGPTPAMDATWHGSAPTFQRSSQAAPLPSNPQPPMPPEQGSGQYTQYPPQEPQGSGQYAQYPPPYPPAYPPYGYPPPGAPMDSSWHGQRAPYPPYDPGLQSGAYGQLSQPPYYPPAPPPGPPPDPSLNSGQNPQQPPYPPYGAPPGMNESWQGQRSYPPGYYPPPNDQSLYSGQYPNHGAQPVQPPDARYQSMPPVGHDPRYQSGQQMPPAPSDPSSPSGHGQAAPTSYQSGQHGQMPAPTDTSYQSGQHGQMPAPTDTSYQSGQHGQMPAVPADSAYQQGRPVDPASSPQAGGLQMPSIPTDLGKLSGLQSMTGPAAQTPAPPTPQARVQIPSMTASKIPLFASPPPAVPSVEPASVDTRPAALSQSPQPVIEGGPDLPLQKIEPSGAVLSQPEPYPEPVQQVSADDACQNQQHGEEPSGAPIKQLKWKAISFEEEECQAQSSDQSTPSLKWQAISFEDEAEQAAPGQEQLPPEAPSTAHWAAPRTDLPSLQQSQEEVVLDRLTAKRVRKDTKKLEPITPQEAKELLKKDQEPAQSGREGRARGPRDTIFDATPPHGAAAKTAQSGRSSQGGDDATGGKGKPSSTHTKMKAQSGASQTKLKAAGASQTKSTHSKLQKASPTESQTKLQKATASKTQKLNAATKASKKDADQTLVLHAVETDVSVLDLLLRCDFFCQQDIQAALMKALGDAVIAPDLLLVLNLVSEKTLEEVRRCQSLIKSGQISADEGRAALIEMKESRGTFDQAIESLKAKQTKKRK